MQEAVDIRDFEIERRLDAFARARLTPDPLAVARARARVMREARLQFEAARIAAHVVPTMTRTNRRPLLRRVATPLLAASMWAAIAVGSVAAAQAGGPLYPARLWVETATLPSSPTDRAAAELARLDARLGDALGAAARGDAGGVAAALAAYRQIADETIAVTTGDEELETLVGAALGRHQAVLTAVAQTLEGKGNTAAAAAVESAIQRAIDHNAAVVAGLADNGGGRGGSGGSGSTSGGSADGHGIAGGTDTGSSNANGGNAGGNGGAVGADNGDTGNGQDGGAKPSKPPKTTPEPTTPGPTPNDVQGGGGNGGGDSQH